MEPVLEPRDCVPGIAVDQHGPKRWASHRDLHLHPQSILEIDVQLVYLCDRLRASICAHHPSVLVLFSNLDRDFVQHVASSSLIIAQ